MHGERRQRNVCCKCDMIMMMMMMMILNFLYWYLCNFMQYKEKKSQKIVLYQSLKHEWIFCLENQLFKSILFIQIETLIISGMNENYTKLFLTRKSLLILFFLSLFGSNKFFKIFIISLSSINFFLIFSLSISYIFQFIRLKCF